MRIYILTREINDSITNVLGAYKNKEQAEQEIKTSFHKFKEKTAPEHEGLGAVFILI